MSEKTIKNSVREILKNICEIWDRTLVLLSRKYESTKEGALTRILGSYRIFISLLFIMLFFITPEKSNSFCYSALIVSIFYLVYSIALLLIKETDYNSGKMQTVRIAIDCIVFMGLIITYNKPDSQVFFFLGIPVLAAYLHFSLGISLLTFFCISIFYFITVFYIIADAMPNGIMQKIYLWGGRSFMLFLIPLIMYYQDRRKSSQRPLFPKKEKLREQIAERTGFSVKHLELEELIKSRSEFLNYIIKINATALDSPTLGLFVYTGASSNQLLLTAGYGYDESAIGKAFIPIGKGVTGWIAQTRLNKIRIDNLLEHPKFEGQHRSYMPPYASDKDELKRMYNKISFIGVCLEVRGELIGVLTASRPEKKGEKIEVFTEVDMDTLRALGDQIEMSQIPAAHSIEIKSITEIMEDVNSSASLDKIFSKIVNSFKKLLKIEACIILEYDWNKKNLVFRDAVCNDPQIKEKHFKKGNIEEIDSMSGKAWKENKEIEFDLKEEKARKIFNENKWGAAEELGINHMISFPINPPDSDRFGVVSISSIEKLDNYDRNLARLLATQASVGIGLARKRIKEIRAFKDVAEKLIEETNVNKMCRAVLDIAIDLTKCPSGDILLFQPKYGSLRFETGRGSLSDKMREIAIRENRAGLIRKAAREVECQLVNDFTNNTDYMPSYPESQTKSQLCIPLYGIKERKIIGVLNLESENKGHFTDYHKEQLELLSKFVGPIIFNKQNQEQFSGFCEMEKEAILISDKTQLLNFVAAKIPSIIQAPVCGIFLWDEKIQKCVLNAGVGFSEGDFGESGYNKGEGRTGKILESGEKKNEQYITEDGKYIEYHKKILRSPGLAYLGVPIKNHKGDVVGVITITRPRFFKDDPNAFIDHGVQLMELISGMLSNSMENIDSIEKGVAAEQEKVEILKKMARAAAHEIRNPLWSTIPALQEIYESFDPSNPYKKEVDNIITSLERVEGVLKNFRDLLIDHPLKMTRIDVSDILIKSIDLCETIMKKEFIEVHKRNIKMGTIISGDFEALSKVFHNILKNAVEAMDKDLGKERKIDISLNTSEVGAIILIEDTGKGIPPNLLNKIFETYFTTKHGTNMGLGLSICKSLVEKHGGEITIESEYNKGTSVKIFLPY